MNIQEEPLNIALLELTDKMLEGVGEVKVLHIFEGSSKNFHPDGLFSTQLFGMVGTEARNRRYAYIDLKIPILHPVIYKAICELKQLYEGIISGKEYAVWDKELMDFVKSTPIDGETGFHFFMSKMNDIKHERRNSPSRDFKIDLVEKYKNKCSLTKLLVMPAGLRDLGVDASGRPTEGEINTMYRQVLGKSSLVTEVAFNIDPEGLNNLRFNIQNSVNAVYEYISTLIDGKKKFILGKFASRQVKDGTRNVITSLINNDEELFSPKLTKANQTRCGLYQYLKGAIRMNCFYIKNDFLSKVFIGQNSPAVLVNKKTLKREFVQIDPGYYDSYMTNEGLEKVITKFGIEELRHKPIEINGYYLGLIYKGPDNTFKVFQDIDELPNKEMRQYVSPITSTELFYLAVYKVADNIGNYASRYPISVYGSVYPGKNHLKTTVRSETRTELDDNWEKIPENIAYEFPIRDTEFVNSMSIHPIHVSRAGAD